MVNCNICSCVDLKHKKRPTKVGLAHTCEIGKTDDLNFFLFELVV